MVPKAHPPADSTLLEKGAPRTSFEYGRDGPSNLHPYACTMELFRAPNGRLKRMAPYTFTAFFAVACVNAVFSVLAVNAALSFMSVNSIGSVLSINSFCSILSANSAFAIGCQGGAFEVCF